jgi:transcriptional regulator with XRE-family HTH domain
MRTVGDRLRFALDMWGDLPGARMGVRTFVERMRERYPDVPGTSRGMIQQYLNGSVEPPLAFLRAASSLLEVRPAWLAFGDGPVHRTSELDDDERRHADGLFSERLPGWDEAPEVVREGLISLSARLKGIDGFESGLDEGVVRLADVMLGPLVEFNLRRLSAHIEGFHRYYLAAYALLTALLDDVRHMDAPPADYTWRSLIWMREELRWVQRTRDRILARYAEIDPEQVPFDHPGVNGETVASWLADARTAPADPAALRCHCIDFHETGDCEHVAIVRQRREASADLPPDSPLPPLTPDEAAHLVIEQIPQEMGILLSASYLGHKATVGIDPHGRPYRSRCSCKKSGCGLLRALEVAGRERMDAWIAQATLD